MDKPVKSLKNLFLVLGILSTLSALIITIHNTQLGLLNFVLIAIYLIQIFKNRFSLRFYRYKVGLVLLFVVFIISSISSIFTLPSSWSMASIIATVKFTLLLFPLLLLFSDNELVYYRREFFNGLLISSWIQFIWEFVQIVLFYGAHIPINDIVFGNLLGVETTHSWTFISNGQFRPSGVSWEPANLALSLIMGFILSKNLFGKILFSFGLILSTSRTGIAIWMLCLILYFISSIKKKQKNISWKSLWIVYLSVFISLIGGILLITKTDVLSIINDSLQRFINGILTNDSSATQHSNYYWQSVVILSLSSLFQILFGYGTAIAGYPFSQFFNIFTWKEFWTPESDFITLLIGNGITGILLYYYFLYKCLSFNKHRQSYFMIILAITAAGFLYIYIRGSWTLLVCMLLFVTENVKKRNFDPADINK